MGLKEIYEASTNSVVKDARDKAATPAADADGVNFYDKDSTYQDNFKKRDYLNKVVTQATTDDATNGKFKSKALLFYADLVGAAEEGTQLYNQRDSNTYYTEINKATRGVTQTYTPAT
jgi:hypothetical protein